jgi:hypothetical protein
MTDISDMSIDVSDFLLRELLRFCLPLSAEIK